MSLHPLSFHSVIPGVPPIYILDMNPDDDTTTLIDKSEELNLIKGYEGIFFMNTPTQKEAERKCASNIQSLNDPMRYKSALDYWKHEIQMIEESALNQNQNQNQNQQQQQQQQNQIKKQEQSQKGQDQQEQGQQEQISQIEHYDISKH